MSRQEHVHIVTAGEEAYRLYAAAIRDLRDVTHSFVFTDTEIYSNLRADDERTKAHKTSVRDAVAAVKTLSTSLKIPCPLVYISPPAFVSVRDAVLTIRKDHPGARFSFDLSGGSKDLGMGLFAISLWLEGTIYYASGTGEAERIAVPEMLHKDIGANPNYVQILTTLGYTPGNPKPSPRVLPRSYIKNQLDSFYVPVRTEGVKIAANTTGKTDARTGKKAVLPMLSQGTFSNILSTMKARGLIEDEISPDNNRKEKYYHITPAGELALRLFETGPR